ncbi:MAG: cytochrome c maturation protein CcmE [Calditrichaceae bacterium]
MRLKYIIGGLIIIGFTVWAGISFNSTLTPYVSIEDAVKSGSVVQVKGTRVDNGNFDLDRNLFVFKLKDDKGLMVDVLYDGAKPGNFDQATEVVCVGQYKEGNFHAKEILVKCPSKYQEEGTKI